jgi:hypothetical protein
MSDSETENLPVSPAEKKKRGAPKGKRTPTPLQLEMLAKARAKANEIRKQQQIVKQETYEELSEEVARFEPEIKMPPNEVKPVVTEKSWTKEFVPPRGLPPPDLPKVCESIVTPDEIKNAKEKKKKKTRIIIEQSSSDEDIFENTDDVIFVKRRGRKDTPKVRDTPKSKKNSYNEEEWDGVDLFDGKPPVEPPVNRSKFTYASQPVNYFNKRFY